MKKLIAILTILGLFVGMQVYAATSEEARAFFNSYITKANTYNASITTLYAPNAKIIRQVVKPNGQLVNVYTNTTTYIKQMKISQGVARARHYKNSYSGIVVLQLDTNKFKITAYRQPKGETYKLKMYQVVEFKNGRWIIVEEMMQTKEQIFLKYAN